jgi:hypothetical protein
VTHADLDLNDDERRCARKKFVRHVYFMDHIEVFYVPSIKGIITRSVNAEREFRLPAGSIRVGTYAHPFDGDAFLGDLDDVLAKQRVDRASIQRTPAV